MREEGEGGVEGKEKVEQGGEEQEGGHLDRECAAARRSKATVRAVHNKPPYSKHGGSCAPEQHRPEHPPPLHRPPRTLAVPACRHHIQRYCAVHKQHDETVVEHAEHVDRVKAFREGERDEGIWRDLQA